jgi:hypothetical protein
MFYLVTPYRFHVKTRTATRPYVPRASPCALPDLAYVPHTVPGDRLAAFVARSAALGTHLSMGLECPFNAAHTLALFGCHALADSGVSVIWAQQRQESKNCPDRVLTA